MKRLKTNLVAVAVILTVALTTGSAFAGSQFNPAEDVAVPKAQLEYVNINAAIQMAAAYGDRSTGAHGTFGKFPPNFDSGIHTHSGAYHGIVVKGVSRRRLFASCPYSPVLDLHP